MAWPLETRAKAMSMLLTGDTVGFTAKRLGVPRQTVSRWKKDSDSLLREIIAASPELQAVAASIRELMPGLGKRPRPNRMGTKKGARE